MTISKLRMEKALKCIKHIGDNGRYLANHNCFLYKKGPPSAPEIYQSNTIKQKNRFFLSETSFELYSMNLNSSY